MLPAHGRSSGPTDVGAPRSLPRSMQTIPRDIQKGEERDEQALGGTGAGRNGMPGDRDGAGGTGQDRGHRNAVRRAGRHRQDVPDGDQLRPHQAQRREGVARRHQGPRVRQSGRSLRGRRQGEGRDQRRRAHHHPGRLLGHRRPDHRRRAQAQPAQSGQGDHVLQRRRRGDGVHRLQVPLLSLPLERQCRDPAARAADGDEGHQDPRHARST